MACHDEQRKEVEKPAMEVPVIAMRRQWSKDVFEVTGPEMSRFKRAGGHVEFLEPVESDATETRQWDTANQKIRLYGFEEAGDGLGRPFQPQQGMTGASTKAFTPYPVKTIAEDIVKTQKEIREFSTGATRDIDTNKLDYEGFLSPEVLYRFATYMHKNRVQPDGAVRDSANWTKGIPLDAYMKSMMRHFMEVWELHRGVDRDGSQEEALCALLFNVQGYLYELLQKRGAGGKRVA